MTELRPPRDPDVPLRISSFCSDGSCVGVATAGRDVAVVDTKTVDGPVLRFSHEEWIAFVAGVKNGEFDIG